MQTHLKYDLEICEWFSSKFHESTYIPDTSELAVMLKIVFSDFSLKDLLKCLPIKGRSTCEVIYKIFITHAMSTHVPLQKFSAITTDATLAMVKLPMDLLYSV